ncbi:MAG: polyribonucleotide nucleotidyltransferase [Chitinivibrionales bacterium]|nr:polyribonucleotide nucleotidyltransferase [Chitinivibrionales bacterium]MBD3395498.1 polyribonucleotide nucleotidyltransferase [Chitinivibrionales bacterium]
MSYQTSEVTINGITVSLETGRMAKQAGGSAVARIGDTMVLATACSGKPREGIDFFPLSVEYVAKTYAAGKIPGGFFKREGKPSEKEVICARLIDRPVRPLFPDGYKDEVQIIATVISADDQYDADVMGITAASCALCLSPMPFNEPVGAVRVGMANGELKVFPTLEETESGGLDVVVAGTEESIMMVEGGAYEVKEGTLVEAIMMAHEEIKKLVGLQKDILAKVGTAPVEFTAPEKDADIRAAVEELVRDRIHEVSFRGQKKERYQGLKDMLAEVQEKLAERFPEKEGEIADAFHEIEVEDMRRTIIQQKTRIGGRGLDTVRDITCDLEILPRAHGSALFTRGETQALVVGTLGTKLDEQRIDYIQAEYAKSYMLHYNFPPYSVGETKRVGPVSRREIGHGHLAERSLSPVLPSEKSFPYTIRLVSEILESNGSSSMASICGGSLALMSAGVPLKSHVAGIAMGLVKEGDDIAILTDILGTEDHLGDMDFKVAGTRDGVTAIQMDIKINGITPEIMRDALAKAHTARSFVLDRMEEAISRPRADLSQYAPRITIIQIDREKIGEVIGPGGKIIREIQESTGTTISIEDDGSVQIAAVDKAQSDAAVKRIQDIVAEPELGAIYKAIVKNIVEFGAFAEYMPGKEGLVHISELDTKRVGKVEDIVSLGDEIEVKLIGFDKGKVRLSRRAVLDPDYVPAPSRGPSRGGGRRPPRR